MIVFASLQSEIAFDMVDVDVGSEIEYPIAWLTGEPEVTVYDPFQLIQSVGRRRKPGDKFAYHNVKHTDSEGSIIENAPSGLVLYTDALGAIDAIGWNGFYVYHPDRDSDHTFSYAGGLYRVTVGFRLCQDANERLVHVTSVRSVFSSDGGRTWSGNLYCVLYTEDGSWYRSTAIYQVNFVRDLPSLRWPTEPLVLDDSFVPKSLFGIQTINPTGTSAVLSGVLDQVKQFCKYPVLPEFVLEDNDIFYDLIDRFTPDTTNWGEFFEGVVDAPEDVANLAQGLVEVGRSNRAVRATVSQLAGLYLFYQYVVKPTPEDLRILSEVESVLRNFSYSAVPRITTRKAYQAMQWTGVQAVEVGLSPSVVDQVSQVDEFLDSIPDGSLRIGSISAPLARERQNEMLNSLSAAGIPTDRYHATRFVTDLIPLSFAANWVFGFNDKLDDLHKQCIWRRIPVDFVCRSIKVYRDRTEDLGKVLEALGVSASYALTTRAYRRTYSTEIPELPLSTNNPNLGRVWDQAAALFLVRFR
jgi:hypothetical protein